MNYHHPTEAELWQLLPLLFSSFFPSLFCLPSCSRKYRSVGAWTTFSASGVSWRVHYIAFWQALPLHNHFGVHFWLRIWGPLLLQLFKLLCEWRELLLGMWVSMAIDLILSFFLSLDLVCVWHIFVWNMRFLLFGMCHVANWLGLLRLFDITFSWSVYPMVCEGNVSHFNLWLVYVRTWGTKLVISLQGG